MHKVTDHKLNGLNEALDITAGETGSGNAPTYYAITLQPPGRPSFVHTQLSFQDKPINTPADYDGLTNEALLAVLIDRMRGFQAGPFACRENALALTHMEEALMWLHRRTRDRIARGVEGSLQK